MRARLIHEIGTRASLRVYWGDDCPSCGGRGSKGYHNAEARLMDTVELRCWKLGGKVEDYADELWPSKCDHCDAVPPPGANRQIFHRKLYDTASGSPEPGDLYYEDYLHHEVTAEDGTKAVKCIFWDNCTTPHLWCILPNGHAWDIDSRANNCDQKDERTHRCWVRHGEPPDVHVDKGGHTCGAGGGSILAEGFHGYLHHGHINTA